MTYYPSYIRESLILAALGLAYLSLFSAPPVAAEIIPIETRVELLIDEEGAKWCDGDFSLASETIRVIELDEVGESLTVLDEAGFQCSTMASVYCGSGGCKVHFLLKADSLSIQVQGWEYSDGKILLGLHGSTCGQVGAEPCYKTVTVKEGRFNVE